MVISVLYTYCQSYSDIRRYMYSDKGGESGRVVGWYSVHCTCTVRVTLTYNVHVYSDKGGEGGRVVISVLYTYCQSYSDIRRYSDKGG